MKNSICHLDFTWVEYRPKTFRAIIINVLVVKYWPILRYCDYVTSCSSCKVLLCETDVQHGVGGWTDMQSHSTDLVYITGLHAREQK